MNCKILFFLFGWLFLCYNSLAAKEKSTVEDSPKRFTIMGIGDSITEGGANFQSYLFPLLERLFTAGYQFDLVGPRAAKCRIGTLNHGGFSGKNAEFLDAHIDSTYRQYPADVVLLHAGHNHFDTEKPVTGIVRAQESIIRKIQAINPDVKILVAQVIPSGKLPKYSYIQELNKGIANAIEKMHNPNVILVNQAKGFDWQKHTINDRVHPNEAGAEQMAEVWFQALQQILPKPVQSFNPEIIRYKRASQGDLNLHIFKPEKLKKGEKRPAIIFFFGGGWTLGTPLQFYRECSYYASKGMVAISAEYRISYLHQTSAFESLEDARDAICWLREHATELNLDTARIAAAGASAGGHLAAATGIIHRNETCSQARPNLLVLYYPVIDIGPEGYGSAELKSRYTEISPLHNIDHTSPPALFILGTKDALIPVKTAEAFQKRMNENGVECELRLIEGAGHPIFYYAKTLTPDFYTIRQLTDNFLVRHGYLEKNEKINLKE
ncbi:MAG: alpha/beta hydrolase fold domain-containing protein [Prolixibacteraceae bacterium]|nr:alpha/beta hydrolase fold domain-containing protein [Prolixibacteraceae bacterium]